MSEIKVLHTIPAYGGTVDVRVAEQAVLDCKAMSKLGIGYDFWWADSSDLCRVRNDIFEIAAKNDYDYLFTQDADVYSPSVSPLAMLLQTMLTHKPGPAMVGAICGLRKIREKTVAPNVRPYVPGKVTEVDRIGTGMVLIDVKQVNSWREKYNYNGPWFARTYHDERQTSTNFGEDFFFCAKCNEHCGIIVADGRVPTIHAYTDHLHLRYPPVENGEQSLPAPTAVKVENV